MAAITYEHVSKMFSGDVAAVQDFSLEVRDQEFMVLVGPSGCGKTTSLRMLAGLEDVDSGTIRIGDKVVNDTPPRNRDVAMVFQSYALYPHMTVFDNMAYGLKVRRTNKPEIASRVSNAAHVLGLEGVLTRKPRQLSGGQRQRVALGRAIVRNPQVFLLDEPLSNLDAKLRVQTRIELQKLHRRLGTTFIYVTHDQVEAMTMGDRIAVMKDGILQQVAPPQQLYDEPINMFVAGFIGTPVMSFVPARVENSTAHASGFAVPLDRPLPASVVLGMRPEAFTPQGRESWTRVVMNVEAVEILGSDKYIYGDVSGDSLTARMPPEHPIRAAESVPLYLDPAKVHFFDPLTELRVPRTESVGSITAASQ